MGLLQATEVVKLVTGAGEPLVGRLLLYEALGASFTELKVRRDPECPICSRPPEEITDEEMGVFPDYEAFCARPVSLSAAMAKIKIPPVLRASVGGEREVEAAGADVGAVLRDLAEQYPELHVAAVRRRRQPEPLRERLPQRRGRARAAGASTRRSARPTR